MECLAYQEKISDYIDNLLPAFEQQEIENHLSACLECNALYQDLVIICQTSRNLPEHEPSRDLWESIRARIAPEYASVAAPTTSPLTARWFSFKGLKSSAWLWQPALAATLLLVGVAAVMYYRPSTPPDSVVITPDYGPNGSGRLEVQPTNRLIVHKSLIEVDLVNQRIDELQKRIQTVQSRWSPEVQALYQRHLKMVDHCLSNCRKNLTTQNDDPSVRAVYQSALRAKLEMLKQFSEM